MPLDDILEEQASWDPFAPHPKVSKPVAVLGDKHKFLAALNTACRLCQMCELGLKEAERTVGGDTIIARDPHVFSNMGFTSRFMVVGQNPGWEELAQGEPFVGAAGKNFNAALTRNGMTRADFYITNATKCFTPSNAKPTSWQQERCSTWLQMEINTIKPILVITLGANAFNVICPDLKYSDSLGKIVKSSRFEVLVYPVYHPSPLNRENLPEFHDQMDRLCTLIIKYRESKA